MFASCVLFVSQFGVFFVTHALFVSETLMSFNASYRELYKNLGERIRLQPSFLSVMDLLHLSESTRPSNIGECLLLHAFRNVELSSREKLQFD